MDGDFERERAVLKTDDENFTNLVELVGNALKRAAANGEHDVLIIPAEDIYWGTGIWHFTADGRMDRANDLLSKAISAIVETDVRVIGGTSRRSESGEAETQLTVVLNGQS